MSSRKAERLSEKLQDFLAKRVRAVYIATRRRHSAIHRTLPHYKVDEQYAYAWPACAAYMILHDLPAEVCVQAKLQLEIGRRFATQPNQLYAERDLPFYQEVRGDYVRSLPAAFVTQQEICRNYLGSFGVELSMPRKDKLEFCLLQEALDLTPLFRYCLAVQERLTAVQNRYRYAAMCQYLTAREAYRKVWKGWLPAGLGRQVDAAVEQVKPPVTGRTVRRSRRKSASIDLDFHGDDE